MPKISILVLLLGINVLTFGGVSAVSSYSEIVNTNLYLLCAFFSLVIGTTVGLTQYRIKRLLSYSTISHVGFLLLALALALGCSTSTIGVTAVDSFLFYIVQYSLTNLNAFFILLAIPYFLNTKGYSDIQ
jgi:NADH-ubiquinone oxidoreductase chain 2